MPLEFGRNAFVNISSNTESTYGDETGLTFDVYNKIFSCTLKRVEERVQTTVLTTTDGGFARGQFKVNTTATGTVEVPLMYEGVGVWLKYALGSASTTGGGPYVHSYLADTTDLPTFGIKFQRGSGAVEQFKGCMISSMTISCNAGEEAKLSCDIIAQTSKTRDPAGITAIYGDGEQVYHFESHTMAYGGNSYQMYNFSMTINNSLETRYVLGSTLTASPDVNDIRSVEVEVTCGLEDQNIYNDHLNGTASTLEIKFQSGADEFKIEVFNAVVVAYDDSVSSVGRLERTFTIKGFSSPTTEAVKITVTNQDASNVGN